jgi:hypothetical protein
MKKWFLKFGLIAVIGLSQGAYTAEQTKYPAPRFPSYTKAPKSVEEVMPFARSIARQTTGLQGDGFGILKQGETVAIVLEATAEDMIVEAIKRAVEERGVKVQILHDYELVGGAGRTLPNSARRGNNLLRNKASSRLDSGSRGVSRILRHRKNGLKRDALTFTTRCIRRGLKCRNV